MSDLLLVKILGTDLGTCESWSRKETFTLCFHKFNPILEFTTSLPGPELEINLITGEMTSGGKTIKAKRLKC